MLNTYPVGGAGESFAGTVIQINTEHRGCVAKQRVHQLALADVPYFSL